MKLLVKRLWRLPLASLGAATLVLLTGAPAAATPVPTWSQLSPPTAPPALRNAVAAYDAADQTVVVFGGLLANGTLSRATWVWNGSTWRKATPYGTLPPARQLASMAYDPSLDQLILFGGKGAGGALLDDTWAWNGASWNEVTTPLTPGARDGAAVAADPAGDLVLFGGYGTSNAPAPVRRTPATPPTSRSTPASTPTPRSTASATAPATTTTTTVPASSTTSSPQTGGTTVPPSSATTTAPATTTTTTVPASSTTSSPQTGGTTVPPSSATTTAPVTTATTTVPAVLDDTWLLSRGSGGADEWLAITTEPTPPPLAGASATDTGHALVLFGGADAPPGHASASSLSDQTWEWDGTAWSHVKTKTAPPARAAAAAAFDSDLHELLVFGGFGRAGTLGDTWAFTDGGWKRVPVTTPPSARSGALLAYDDATRQLVLFGGTSPAGAVLADTDVLTKEPPAEVAVTPTTTIPPPTTAAPAGSSTTTALGRTRSSTTPSTTTPSTTARALSHPSTSTTPLPGASATVHRGDVITLTGAGFLPHARVTITFHSDPALVVATTRANAAGRFRVSVSVPLDAATGDHHFVASGRGPHGTTTLVTEVKVVAFALSHGVSEMTAVSLTAIAIAIPVLTWLALGVVGRRRRTARA